LSTCSGAKLALSWVPERTTLLAGGETPILRAGQLAQMFAERGVGKTWFTRTIAIVDGERWTSTRFPSTIQTSQTQELGFRRFAASSIRPTIAFRQHSRHRIDAGASPVDTLGLTGVSLGARWANARKRSRLYGGSIGYSLPTGVRPMRLNQETLGRVRAVLFGIVFALVLIAYALHRLHL